jgi:CRP/FNR family transcriptional regulator
MSSPYGLEIVECCECCPRREELPFCDLTGEALRAFDELKSPALYPKGALFFLEGQPPRGVFVLCAGRVKLWSTSGDGHVIITHIARPVEILGLCATLTGEPHAVTAETTEACQVNFVGREDFLSFLASHPDACFRAAQQLSRNYRAALGKVRLLGLSYSAASKFARFLLESSGPAAGAGGEAQCGPDSLRLTLTHEEIGQAIGASRETVTRLVGEFKRGKLIEVRGATLLLSDRHSLERLAEY